MGSDGPRIERQGEIAGARRGTISEPASLQKRFQSNRKERGLKIPVLCGAEEKLMSLLLEK